MQKKIACNAIIKGVTTITDVNFYEINFGWWLWQFLKRSMTMKVLIHARDQSVIYTRWPISDSSFTELTGLTDTSVA